MHATPHKVPVSITRADTCPWSNVLELPRGSSVRASVRDITSPALIVLKALLFVVLGTLAASLLVARDPAVSTVLLVAVTVWAFARAYFFAFTVIEKYIDPDYRFAGLFSAARWIVRRTKGATSQSRVRRSAR